MKKKKMFAVRIDEKVLEDVRDLVYWEHGVSLTSFVERVLREVVTQWPKPIKKRPSK